MVFLRLWKQLVFHQIKPLIYPEILQIFINNHMADIYWCNVWKSYLKQETLFQNGTTQLVSVAKKLDLILFQPPATF